MPKQPLAPVAGERPVYSVRALTLYIKGLLDADARLGAVWVRGEISNFKRHGSGHLYFTLKDEHAALRAVMFKSRAERLRFGPENGQRVIIGGYVSVYEPGGVYQLYAETIEPDGLGALHLAFEQLKLRLQAEGLFDPAHKRPLPLLPAKVGIVTSPTGAALRDIITVACRRWPGVHLVLAPALVQGDGAVASTVQALGRLARLPGIEVIIVGRGGGSLEELWAFNSEEVARAIRACPVPVVAAVGHATDVTIACFAADVRAATPSAAAELVVPARAELQASVAHLLGRLHSAARRRIQDERYRLALLARRGVLQRPDHGLLQARQRLDELVSRLGQAAERRVERGRARLAQAAARLEALSPLRVLARGYSIVSGPDGTVLRQAGEVAVGAQIAVRLSRGRLWATVERTANDSDGDAATGDDR